MDASQPRRGDIIIEWQYTGLVDTKPRRGGIIIAKFPKYENSRYLYAGQQGIFRVENERLFFSPKKVKCIIMTILRDFFACIILVVNALKKVSVPQ